MGSELYTLYTVHFVQAAGAAFLAILLARFHGTYGHSYLREWSRSWAAFCVYVIGALVAVLWTAGLPLQHPLRLLVTAGTLVAGYWQIAWVLFGTYAGAHGAVVPRHWRLRILAVLFVVAAASALAFSGDPAAADQRFFMRVGLRQGVAGVFFVLAGAWLARHGAWRQGFGRAIVAATFLLYGIEQSNYFVINVLDLLVGYRVGFDLALLGFVDFLIQFAMGIGMVIWLLESERDELQRTSEALRQSEQRLGQSQRLEAVGQLAGGVAHDFNNLLTVILGRAQLLLERLPEGSGQRDEARQIDEAAQSAAALVRQLLAFSRRQILEPQSVNLNEVVKSVTTMLRRSLGEQITLRCTLDPDIGLARVDAPQIEQVLVNLALNARDAMPEGGDLDIETENVFVSGNEEGFPVDVVPGPHVCLTVRDSGVGMDEGTQRHIFEPFFTTKETGKGSGLGLATAYGVVRQSRGQIVVNSAPDSGTEVRVYLPRVEEAAAPAGAREPLRPEAAAVVAAEQPSAGTILVVEDEPRIRSLLSAVLGAGGYNVLLAADGMEALDLAAANETPVDLLLTDVVMPEIGGPELADRLVERWPDLNVLFMSGYSQEVLPATATAERRELLEKPFTIPDLLKRVRAALQG